jgi:hypothetical protein
MNNTITAIQNSNSETLSLNSRIAKIETKSIGIAAAGLSYNKV